jgi:putative oxygen-independent coproporphyrinogen III oxidase
LETYAKKITPRPTPAKLAAGNEQLSRPAPPRVRSVANETLGVYVHFPWCLKKCPYCDFLSVAAPPQDIPHVDYAEAVLRELTQRVPTLSTRRVHSVFFGGGTPSLWQPQQLGRVLQALARELSFTANVEITVECNPTSFSPARAQELKAVGVNRVSIGVQALEQERLEFLGRLHNPSGGLRAVADAVEAGIERVSADLIYGVYRQDPATAVREVTTIAALGVSHLSAYALTVEPGTQFGAQARRGTLPLLEDDLVAESFSQVSEALQSNGFRHYEISNFARNEERCRHNLGYWQGEQYLGLGCGAWGTIALDGAVLRYRNTISPERYSALTRWPTPNVTNADADAAYQQVESIDAAMRVQERLLLGLRLDDGVDICALSEEFGDDWLNADRKRTAARLVQSGRLVTDEQRWRIPKSAWLFADAVIRDLL